MLPKWKLILSNWINCYFNSSNTKDLPVNLESLIDIISHLRENLNLDETKSSLLDAHTVQEFVAEKFPDFKFKNGTIEPEGEEDVYIVASLLLFFVCVNSKNVDMKSAMCSKLSTADQEIILKFSKQLMECSKINIEDVQAAIIEACGKDPTVTTSSGPMSLPASVAETPPALRSFHSELRRLQAALDAERFDRTYLQEELTRTNVKLEKLLKDKEEYKLQIVNLKSQISMCCGQETESKGEHVERSNVSKLIKQLEQMEERLLRAQEQLEDVQEERENYKAKLSQLKLEHDKLLVLSHQESARANGLAEELEVERRHTQSLRELVCELRQHNKLNKMDSSLVECDDPDASIHSLPHNSSMCSEVCANVIEVQLGEERAKIVALKQNIEMLQDQLSEMTKQTEEQKESLTQIISDRDNTIMTLKHRVNEEMEEKNTIKQRFDDEVARLSNELLNFEERLRVTQENSRHVIENKMKEIQDLQNDKLSLLQNLSDETSKSEITIKHLRDEIDTEKTSKIKQRNDYECVIMELNEKILNRHNELVELQNKILEKSKVIDTLQLDLKRGIKLREELSNKHIDELTHLNTIREQLERECRAKDVECNNMGETIRMMAERLQSAQEQLVDVQVKKEATEANLMQLKFEHEKLLAFSQQESARAGGLAEELEAERENIAELRLEIQMLQDRISENTKKTEGTLKELGIEREKLKQMISEKESAMMTLKHRLNEEIQEKNNIKRQTHDEVAKLKDDIVELEQRLKGTQENSRHIIENKMKEIQNLQEEKLSLLQSLSNETNKSEHIIKTLKEEIDAEKALKIKQKDEFDSQIMKLNEKMLNRNNELVELQNKILEKGELIETLQIELKREKELKEELSNRHNEELTHLNSLREQLERECQVKDVECSNMDVTMRQLVERLQLAQEQLVHVQKDKETTEAKLSQVTLEHDKLLALSHQESSRANELVEQLEVERLNVVEFKHQIQRLQDQISEKTRKTEEEKEQQRMEEEKLNRIISEKENIILNLKHTLNEAIQEKNTLKKQFDDEVAKLKNEIIDIGQRLKGTQENSQKIIENKIKEIQDLQQEKQSLLKSLSDDTNKSENIIKHLTDQIDSEKSSKIRQREEYDNQIMKLNEKMLNRNNELVELQNRILEKGEFIETLQLELRREKELREELSNRHNEELARLNSLREQLEKEIRAKDVECNNMGEKMRQLEERLQRVEEERETYKTKLSQVQLEHEKLLVLSQQESTRASGLAEELEAERENIVALRLEINMLQEQLSESTRKTEEEKEKERMKDEKLNEIMSEKENTIANLKHRLNEEIHEKNSVKKQCDEEIAQLNADITELEQRLRGTQENSRNIIENKLKEIQHLQEEKISLLQIISDETNKLEKVIKQLKDEIDAEKASKSRQRDEYDSQMMKLNEKMLNRNNELVELQNKILEKGEFIETLQLELKREKELREELSNRHNEELTRLNSIKQQLEREYQEKHLECNKMGGTIKQLEERLQKAQEQLTDVQKEKDAIETELRTVTSEHEKLMALSQQESTRADGLAEELEAERRNTQSLRELVSELQEQDKLNNMDSGVVECENASHSVKEAQLEEERAQVLALKQLIQSLQDQLIDVTRKTEGEKDKQRTERIQLENNIMALKHKVDEEIEEKNTLKKKFDDEVAKLNNDIQELEDRLKGTQENSRNIIENKMKEIKELKDEQLVLLQSLSDESSKSENVFKNLRDEIDAEKCSKNRQRDEYDGQMMKLNEKMLNRNNELVELQNKIVEKGEIIETLQLELRREKELKDEISNKHNEELTRFEQNLVRKSEEAEDLHKHLQQHIALIEQLNEENESLKANMAQLQEDCKMLKESEEKLLAELKDRDVHAEQIYKETENLRNLLFEEKQKLLNKVEEFNAVKSQQNENQPPQQHTGPQMISNAVMPLVMQTCMDAANQEKSSYKSASQGTDDRNHQVDTTPTDHTPTSFECCKTISDLEKILQDRNRTIRALQSDIIDLKSLVAESENKLLDVSNDLEVSKENCQQLSNQLKKIVHQKNEEIADLKKQLTKMSMTENRASQIIKVSAKYQAIILKRIAEIKSNTVLKELTNFGNTTNGDNELRRGLNTKTITMEDLENFLDTTDRHLKRFSEKQIALQKERDRLAEVNKINESEIINMRKFLTELSVSIKTFNSVKDLYAQKLSRVVSLQRTVRREILGLDGQISDATMCKLERGYAAVMQDLSECAMNLERWVERTIGRVISVEKIKQAFSSEERSSVAPTTVQNASLEVQLEELESSFCKLLEEVARAQKGEAAKATQAATVMEVRAEYEDKLNRMKAKMKELYQEQIGIFKERQREEIVSLEKELQRAKDKLEESSRAYEQHIRSLTMELWNVGEKFLMKKDEAEWLRRKQRSGSLMSLQHMHSSGLVPTQEEPSRQSDTHSLRSLPVTNNANGKSEGRTLQMSDEEGEVFDNRCLRELATTPASARAPRASRAGRHSPAPARRLSELQWRNSLCPPHLKSSYPAETQFVPAIHEEDIKSVGPAMSVGGKSQRKEVGITAYKKPGPPTPSKQAGRLSATDSELRESLRVDHEPNASRKTGTPSRIRALFRSGKGDNEGTPRSRRLSNIFRKK